MVHVAGYDVMLIDIASGIIWLLFENARIGTTTRNANAAQYPEQVGQGWTPIVRIKKFKLSSYPTRKHQDSNTHWYKLPQGHIQ